MISSILLGYIRNTTIALPLSAGRITMDSSSSKLCNVFESIKEIRFSGLDDANALLTPVLSYSAAVQSSCLAVDSVLDMMVETGINLGDRAKLSPNANISKTKQTGSKTLTSSILNECSLIVRLKLSHLQWGKAKKNVKNLSCH